MTVSKRQLPALTGIRFFLALWVVVFHQGDSLVDSIGGFGAVHRLAECFVWTGYAAVSAFFVLSGFVLTYNYDLGTLRHSGNDVRFGIARFSRIYPAYAAGLLMLVPFAIYRLAVGIESTAGNGPGQFLLNAFLVQAWVPSAVLSWNYPGWSLSDEAFFYATLPFLGLWISRFAEGPAKRAVTRLLVLAAALWILSLALPLFAVLKPMVNFGGQPASFHENLNQSAWVDVIEYNPLVRLPEFCIGVVVALLYRLIPARSWLSERGPWLYLPAIAVILLVLGNADRIPFPLVHNGLLAPAYAAMILGMALGGGFLVRILSSPTLVFLGGASYSIYILHAPVYGWMSVGFVRVLHQAPRGLFWLICYVTVVVALSSLFFGTLEDPLHRRLRLKLNGWAEGFQRDVSASRK